MRRHPSLGISFAAVGLLVAPLAAVAAPFGPTPYSAFADSPFAGLAFADFQLEDFEDGALNVPGVTASVGQALAPGALTDSVDADDGVIDGSGSGGWSWYVNATSITFTFDPGAPGGLPTHAGIVWTDVGTADEIDGFGNVTFESFDALGDPLDTIGPAALGDGAFGGGTSEDRFFGSIHAGGISAIRITMNSADWEIDHLQFGRVPEPGAASLIALALAALGVARRR
jgi:hypothetical protein